MKYEHGQSEPEEIPRPVGRTDKGLEKGECWEGTLVGKLAGAHVSQRLGYPIFVPGMVRP